MCYAALNLRMLPEKISGFSNFFDLSYKTVILDKFELNSVNETKCISRGVRMKERSRGESINRIV